MEIKDLRTNETTKHVIIKCALDYGLNGIPTSNVKIKTSLGFEITINRLELVNMFNYIVSIDKTIEEAIVNLKENSAGY